MIRWKERNGEKELSAFCEERRVLMCSRAEGWNRLGPFRF